MALAAGTRLGVYEIVRLIGAGGMGEVYRARDSRLRRDVALKILPPVFTADADRVARFEREARLLAALNHPHIGAIYGFEDGDVPALVLELVEGDTLENRVRRGPLALAVYYSRDTDDTICIEKIGIQGGQPISIRCDNANSSVPADSSARIS